jgi:tetratricopeptide (TPR) repeat protein
LLRVEYEGLLAESFEERGGFRGRPVQEIPGDAAVFMAEHYLRGGRKDCGDDVVLRALDHLAALYRNESLLELADLTLHVAGPEEARLRFETQIRQAGCLELLARRAAQRAACEGALGSAKAAGDPGLVVRGRLALAELLQGIADYDGAQDILEACLASDAASGPEVQARSLGCLGRVSLLRGDHVRSEECYERQRAIHRSLGSDRGVATALQDLAGLYVWTGRYSQARECLREALELWSREGSKRGEATTSGALGIVLSHEGRYDMARSSFERSLSVSREIGYRHGEAVAEANLAQLSLEEGRLDEADGRLQLCAELSAALHLRHLDIYVLLYRGHLARARLRADAARSLYEESLELSRSTKARAASAEAALALGRLLFEDGDAGRAKPLLREAVALVAEMSLAEPGAVPGAYLALLGEAEPSTVPVSEATSIAFRAEAHLVLAIAGARKPHAAQALVLFERMSQHLSGDEAERFWSQNPNARRLRSLAPAPS